MLNQIALTPMQYYPRYKSTVQVQVYKYVPHLDLVDFGQNSNRLMLRPRNPHIHGNVPRFHPGNFFFILTLHTLRP